MRSDQRILSSGLTTCSGVSPVKARRQFTSARRRPTSEASATEAELCGESAREGQLMAPRDDVLSHAIREVVLFGVTFMFWNGSTMNAPASSRQ
jgi:hypothetical protein